MTAVKKSSTMKNTLKCILVLGVISVVCVALLAVANRFLKAEITLDKSTATLINGIAPTGVDDDTALNKGYIKIIDLSRQNYAIKSIDDYNKANGSNTQKVRALYTSKNADTGKTVFVVEAEGKGYVDAIVMLIAYDEENKVSALVTKSQSESYWSHITDFNKLYAAFVGTSGRIDSERIASSTGVTVKGTLGGMSSAVSIANDFMAQLGGTQNTEPAEETDSIKIGLLKKVSSAEKFTRYTVSNSDAAPVYNVYTGDNGDIIIESHADGGTYGKVTLLVRVADGRAAELTFVSNSFQPENEHDSSELQKEETLNSLFEGKSLSEVNAMAGSNLAGTSGVTQSCDGLVKAVANALEYAPSFDASLFTKEGA